MRTCKSRGLRLCFVCACARESVRGEGLSVGRLPTWMAVTVPRVSGLSCWCREQGRRCCARTCNLFDYVAQFPINCLLTQK